MSQNDPMPRIHHMCDAAKEAVEMIENHTRENLDTNRMLNLSLTRLVEIIGEAATQIPEEFRLQYHDIPWREMSGTRNRLIHCYDTIDCDVLWTIVKEDLPVLILKLEEIIRDSK